jgi:hypothetical protein
MTPSNVTAALSAQPIAEGWVVVSEQPTFQQVVAGRKALGKRPCERNYPLVEEIYRAMIAAIGLTL